MISQHEDAAALNRRIVETDAKKSELERQLAEANRTVAAVNIRHRYRRLQQVVRSPARSFELWPLGIMLVAPLFIGALMFAVWQTLSGSYGTAFTLFFLATGVTAALLAWILFLPNGPKLDLLAQAAAQRLRLAQETANAASRELSIVRNTLKTDTQSRGNILKSVQYQRELLLQHNWKAMRGSEWESYLAQVLSLLGATVEPTGASGDQGVDLIAEIGPLRYAIQAKGYVSSVGNGAVQEAMAGMAHYRCNACAVITNSRFTSGAVALAESNGCTLIGEDDIPALVLGSLSLGI